MPHRAKIYSVRVRQKRDTSDASYRPLGDIDGSGTALATLLGRWGPGLAKETADGTTRIACHTTQSQGNEVFMVFNHGHTGEEADIFDEHQELQYHQEVADTHSVIRACLFVLPPKQTKGWLAVHVNRSRSAKELLVKAMEAGLGRDVSDAVLEVAPVMTASALKAAIQQDRLEKVELVTWQRPSDIAEANLEQWVRGGSRAKLILDITSQLAEETKKGTRWVKSRLASGPLQRFLDGDRSALDTILLFKGIRFDEAHATVDLGNGTTRTFNIEHPEGGHPISEDLNLGQGDPDIELLRQRLRSALNDYASPSAANANV